MLSIINVVAPVFALIALGYGAVRFKFYPASGVNALVLFVNNFASPVLLFRSMLNSDFRSVFNLGLIVPFYIGAGVVMVAGIVIARKAFGNGPGESVSSGFAATFSNSLLIGYPVVHRAYGDAALPYIFSIIGVHSPLLLTVGMLAMEVAQRDSASMGRTLVTAGRRIATNPLIWGIVLGVAANFAGLRLSGPTDAFTTILSQAVVPVALFGIGGALNEYRFSENWPQAGAMTVLKLIVHPAIAYVLMVWVLHLDIRIARYGVLLAAMPSGINAYVFATYYDKGTNVAANSMLIGTLASAVAISAWLIILG
jgi:predicted permease